MPLSQPLNPAVSTLFRSLNTKTPVQNSFIAKGALIAFQYQFWKKDAYPLVLVSNVIQGQKIFGVNLHYLTFPFIRQILKVGGGNLGFSWIHIKNSGQYLTHAFRSYKWQGIRQVRMLDTQFLLTVMATVRSFDPNQIQAIRKSVQEQMQRMVNPKAVPGVQPQV